MKLSQCNLTKEMCRNELGESSPKNTYMQQNGTYIKALYLRKDTTNFKSWQQKVDVSG